MSSTTTATLLLLTCFVIAQLAGSRVLLDSSSLGGLRVDNSDSEPRRRVLPVGVHRWRVQSDANVPADDVADHTTHEDDVTNAPTRDEKSDGGDDGHHDDNNDNNDNLLDNDDDNDDDDDDTSAADNDDDNDDDDNDDDVNDGAKSSVTVRAQSQNTHGNAAAIAELKVVWRGVISSSTALAGAGALTSSSGSTIASASAIDGGESTQQVSVVHIRSSAGGELLRANGTDRASFLRQLEAQLTDPLATATATTSLHSRGNADDAPEARRALWLDRDLVLALKGSAVLAQHPDLLATQQQQGVAGKTSNARYSPSRGVRLESPSSSYSMLQAVVRALSRALGCTAVSLNRRAIDAVRAQALARAVPKRLLSTANLVSALLDEVEEQGLPALVALDDDLNWLLGSQATSEVLLEEVKNVASRAFFVMLSPAALAREQLKVGQTAAALRAQRQQQPSQTSSQQQQHHHQQQPQQQGGMPNFANMFSSFPFGPHAGQQQRHPGNGAEAHATDDDQQQQQQQQQQQHLHNNGSEPHPSLPPGVTFGRSFQVTIQNGSASLSPIPNLMDMAQNPHAGGPFPFPLPPGVFASGPFPFPPSFAPGQGPPPEVMRRILEEQQRRMMQQDPHQQQHQPPPPQLPPPPFPPHLSEEELHEYLANPDNQPAVKEFLDKVMEMVMSQMPPGLRMDVGPDGQPFFTGAGATGPNGEAPRVEVKVHMMQVPSHLMGMGMGMPVGPMGPFPFPTATGFPPSPPPPQAPSPPPAATDPSTDEVDDEDDDVEEAADKQEAKDAPPAGASPKKAMPGLGFFRRMTSKKASGPPKASRAATSAAKEATNKKKKETAVADDNNDNDDSEPYDDERRGGGEPSAGGKALLSAFETLVVEAPRDQSLRALWERMADEETCDRIAKANRRLLGRELRRLGLWSSSSASSSSSSASSASSASAADSDKNVTATSRGGAGHGVGRVLRGMDDLLQRQVLSEDDVRRAVAAAVRLQAGTFDALRAARLSSSSPPSSTAEGAAVPATTNATTANATTTAKLPRRPRLRLSLWALDTALNAVMSGTLAAVDRAASSLGARAGGQAGGALRTKEEISAMVTDKHERALIANVIMPQEIGVSYDMIGGLGDVKEALRQCVTYPLKYPRLYQEGVAQEAVKGVLLFGPPGTGKTMLAKAVATEGGATFLTVDASTIENKWLGESEKNAKAVFTLARRLAPCVVYLDEVDSVLSSREHGDDSSHGTLTSVKTTLMQEWDGLRTTKDRVVVIASTNRPFDLDEAVLRRLPRRIMVDLPDLSTRRDIMAVTLAGNRLGPDVNLTRIAESLDGYTGSDIKEVCREAVVRIAHERARQLEAGLDIVAAASSARRARARTVVAAAGVVADDAVDAAKGDDEADDDAFGFVDAASADVDANGPLRPVCAQDFKEAMKKLKASVDEGGRELQKVHDWNSKYGEVKGKGGAKGAGGNARGGGSHMSLYI